MRDTNSLTTSKIERAWAVNNSMGHKPHSMHEVTKRLVHILDAKLKRQTSNQLLVPTVLTQVSKIKISYWSYSQSLRNFLMEH